MKCVTGIISGQLLQGCILIQREPQVQLPCTIGSQLCLEKHQRFSPSTTQSCICRGVMHISKAHSHVPAHLMAQEGAGDRAGATMPIWQMGTQWLKAYQSTQISHPVEGRRRASKGTCPTLSPTLLKSFFCRRNKTSSPTITSSMCTYSSDEE